MAFKKPLVISSGQPEQIQAGDYVDPSGLGSGSGGSTKFLREDSSFQDIVPTNLTVHLTTYSLGNFNDINLASAPSVIDGVTVLSGYKVLVAAQTNQTENGIYDWNGVGVAMTRTVGYTSQLTLRGQIVQVLLGNNQNMRRTFINSNSSTISVGSTAIIYSPLIVGNNNIIVNGANVIGMPYIGPGGTFGAAYKVPILAINMYGVVYSMAEAYINITYAQVTDFAAGVALYTPAPPVGISRGKVEGLAKQIHL